MKFVLDMSRNSFAFLNELFAKRSPQTLYSYKLRPVFKFGSIALSAVLFTYSYSFADVSYLSATKQNEAVDEQKKKSILFQLKAYGPIGLTVVPFTLALGSLMVFSRVVTKVVYIPNNPGSPLCEITRKSAILGRTVSITKPLSTFSKPSKVKIFTGKGEQGIDDKSSFCFYLMDRSPDIKWFFNKVYILPRSGKLWKSDGRLISALFKDEAVNPAEIDLSHQDVRKLTCAGTKSVVNSIEDIIKVNTNKANFHINMKGKKQIVRNIVNKTSKL